MSPNPFMENFLLWALVFGQCFFLCRFLNNKWGRKGKFLFLFLSLFSLVRYFLFGHIAAWNFFLNHAQNIKNNQRVINILNSVLTMEARHRSSLRLPYLFVGGSYMEAAMGHSLPSEVHQFKLTGFTLIEVFTLEKFFRKLRPKTVIFPVGISEFTHINGVEGEYFYLDGPNLLQLPFLSQILLQEGVPRQAWPVFRNYLLNSLFPEKRYSPLFQGLLEDLKNTFFNPENAFKKRVGMQVSPPVRPSNGNLSRIILESLEGMPTAPPSFPPLSKKSTWEKINIGIFNKFLEGFPVLVDINIEAFNRFLQGFPQEGGLKFIMVEGVINPRCGQIKEIREIREYFSNKMTNLDRVHPHFVFIPWDRPSPFGEEAFSDCFHLVGKENSQMFMREMAHLLEKHQI